MRVCVFEDGCICNSKSPVARDLWSKTIRVQGLAQGQGMV